MLKDIQLFRDFVANVTDNMINNAIVLINVAGWMAGICDDETVNDDELIKCAIEYSTCNGMPVFEFIRQYNERLKQEKQR